MRLWLKRTLIFFCVVFLVLAIFLVVLARKEKPTHIEYGISYNVPYIHELGLDEHDVLDAFINELGARNFRMSAHWTLIEPKRDQFDFEWMDRDLKKVEQASGTVIFGIGRRLPRWPECHVPGWAQKLSWEDQKQEILEYIEAVVTRYKDSPAITYWQVENEPYLSVFAYEHCGEFDEAFLAEEIALVRKLDPTRKILVTDSGNLGTWNGPFAQGDVFGTSVYVYFWNPELGQFSTLLPPWAYRVKDNLMQLVHGERETMLIELSLEPWLLEPVAKVPVDVQLSRMNPEKFDEIIAYAEETRYTKQYLWGGEWWYWLKEQGDDALWEKGKKLFNQQ